MQKEKETTAFISLHALKLVCNSVDQEIGSELSGIFAQERTRKKAEGYIDALCNPYLPGKSAWEIAEYLGYETPGPVQSLIGENKWSSDAVWRFLAVKGGKLAEKDTENDPLGVGIIFDETADVKRGKKTCGVGYQHAGCVGKVANCATWVMASLTGKSMRTWAAADLFLPEKDWFTGRGATGTARRKAAGVPGKMKFASKPKMALKQLRRVRGLGVNISYGGGDEVYGRYADLLKDHERNSEAYAYFVPRNHRVKCCDGKRRRVDELPELDHALFESRPAGPGAKGPRYYDWAMIGILPKDHYLLLRRPPAEEREILAESARAEKGAIQRQTGSLTGMTPGKTGGQTGQDRIKEEVITFCLCYVPPKSPIAPTLSSLVLMAGRRWGAEEANETGKGPIGWDENQFRKWESVNHHTALSGVAMLRANMILQRLEMIRKGEEEIQESPAGERPVTVPANSSYRPGTEAGYGSDDFMIPIGDSRVPAHADQEIPDEIGFIKLSRNEALRLAAIAISDMDDEQKAFHLRWSKWRRKHQATSRWYHRVARMKAGRESDSKSTMPDLMTVSEVQSKARPWADFKAA